MSNGKPRLRFAPSPTGYLHIGGVRTALFNWLWARKTGGTFVLRIEDTDRERSTADNEELIYRDMRWLGLLWDEGPTVGGPFGPYKQMERLAIYAEFGEKLVRSGAAYRCFCTKEELAQQREALKVQDPKATFRYPGTCRDRQPPFPDLPWVLRLRAPAGGSITYRDLVFGEVSTPNSSQQDAVLMRSDGVPLYNLGAVVDDITMGITLVCRGRDHMINTPLQILLYEALGHAPPAFAHLPMLLAPDGQKLSKRHGAVSVGDYRDRGIPADALLNYLVRFGWSFGDQEVFSIRELIEKFDFDHCSKADGKFDAKKLAAIAFEHMKEPRLLSDDAYADGVLPYLSARGLGAIDRDMLIRAIPAVRERGQSFADAADRLDFFFRDPPSYDDKAVKKFLIAQNAAQLSALRDILASAADFTPQGLEAAVGAWLATSGLELKDVSQPVRVAVTGRAASPGLFEVLSILGKGRSVARIDHALSLIGPVPQPSKEGSVH
jgi:glutamyl-tRNA synthetase